MKTFTPVFLPSPFSAAPLAGESNSIAPGKVTLTSRLPGRPGGAMEPSPLTEPYSSYEPRPALDDPFGLHLESGAAQPNATAAAVRLAVPPQIDFGEVPVGETQRESVHVYNLHNTGSAYVSALLAGSHEIQLGYPAPERLRPSGEDPGIPFTLVYQPKERGRTDATLKVGATWETYTGWAPVTLEIPVKATAYAFGEEKPSVVEAERSAEEEREAADAASRAHDAALDKKVEADNTLDAPYPQGAENLFDNAFLRAHDALDLLGDYQIVGIEVASAEAETFRRKIPVSDPDLLTTLAFGALDMATYGLSGMASSWARSVMSKTITIPPQWRLRKGIPVPPRAGATATETTNLPLSLAISVAEALKKGIRDAGKSGRERLQNALTKTDASQDETVSQDARIEFFAQQKLALADSKNDRAEALRVALSRLRPLMRGKKPEEAAAAMNAIAEGFEKAVEKAKTLQADETRFGWMSFLARQELGDNLDARNLPRENEPLPGYDGVLDLELSADYHDPLNTLKIRNAKMNGVTQAMALSLSLYPISELLKRGIVIRTHFKIPELAVMPVVLSLDGDRVRFQDQTGADGQTPHWLSLLVGYTGRPSPERQRLGALALRDWLKDKRLDQFGLQVETDNE